MPQDRADPIRPTDAQARGLARALINAARFGALAVLDPDTGSPLVTRISVGTTQDGALLSLVSSLSQHTAALRANPACSVLVGEPTDRGDPLSHPRLTLQCRARFIEQVSPDHTKLRESWLLTHPKAKLYIDFGDFGFVELEVQRGFLNGGFGKAFVLTPDDLGTEI